MQISINGQSRLIHINLYSAIRQVQKHSKEMRLWIDALCINQYDHEEKARQILLMASIFKRSRQVISWICKEDKDTQ